MTLRQIVFGVLAALLLTTPVAAQAKPIGLYDPGPTPPAWATFGTLADWYPDSSYHAARDLSVARPGFVWIMQLGYAEPVERPIGPHAERIRARLEATGLRPYVVALTVREEWYEHWQAGEFTRLGLPPSAPWGVDVIREWAGRQQIAATAVLGVPAIWITTGPNNDPRLYPYRPVPAGTGFVAVDAYVPRGGSFAWHVAPILGHAERTTDLPLVLIPQWFRHEGDPLWHDGPSPDDVAQYFQWFARPRWAALLGFTWRSRGNGIVGAVDLPTIRAAIEHGVSK